MAKPNRRRVYLFLTRQNGDCGQLLVFSHRDPNLWAGVQTPGGTIEPGEDPLQAALREANEETGLSAFGEPRLLCEDDYENLDEVLRRYFIQLPVLQCPGEVWTHRVLGDGVDSGIEFELRWVDLPDGGDLDEHFKANLELITCQGRISHHARGGP